MLPSGIQVDDWRIMLIFTWIPAMPYPGPEGVWLHAGAKHAGMTSVGMASIVSETGLVRIDLNNQKPGFHDMAYE
jgi:hypothetical protein